MSERDIKGQRQKCKVKIQKSCDAKPGKKGERLCGGNNVAGFGLRRKIDAVNPFGKSFSRV